MSTFLQEQYIELMLGEEHYAIRIQDIDEIIRMKTITDIPGSLPHVKGVINLRNKITPVISLRTLFRLPDVEATKTTRIIVVRHQGESIGIIVDQVHKVSTYSDIVPPPEQVGGVSGARFSGIGLREGCLVGILNMTEVLG
ncbi:chemotaxis protein CheW [Paenibacillus filicis]|uniref:Chemotaxis protein CheW n=1 Tax=Paenibacillus filicis TaxID=669464 RepID=A0ABU9DWR6_9BACL